MPKLLPEATFNEIEKTVSKSPKGASLTDIAGALKNGLPRRTLQRHLA